MKTVKKSIKKPENNNSGLIFIIFIKRYILFQSSFYKLFGKII